MRTMFINTGSYLYSPSFEYLNRNPKSEALHIISELIMVIYKVNAFISKKLLSGRLLAAKVFLK